MSDKKIVCKVCGQEFDFSAGEQEYYAARNLSEPKNCKPCRDKRRQEKESNGSKFGGNKSGGSSFGGNKFGGNSFSGSKFGGKRNYDDKKAA